MLPQQKNKESNKKMTAGQFADIVAEMRAAQKREAMQKGKQLSLFEESNQ